MKKLKLALACGSLLALAGCASSSDSVTASQAQDVNITDGHYRLEAFHKSNTLVKESLARACHDAAPQEFAAGKGKESFWVAAQMYRSSDNLMQKMSKVSVGRGGKGPSNSKPQRSSLRNVDQLSFAFVQLEGEFEANKNYLINRKRAGDRISVWAEEAGTGKVVSNVAKSTYTERTGVPAEIKTCLAEQLAKR